MNKTTPRAWSDIEDDFIRISGPIIATTDLLAEFTSKTDSDISDLREGTVYNISERCCVGILEIKDLFYELAELYSNAKEGRS
ncbi:MAG: hypothetical protein K1563_07810 [Candidatus Thiodiazotropha sp. (ex. Lucinisca nassula)]|nr:hypothetical protein [Candidatus Thiodiazotropha sp. (ex. Lucinisca nassula)]MBW9273579.1 hypothetical protein [Candidatus Thiodiazotropha sp. (ex. Lucinisca nassula)]